MLGELIKEARLKRGITQDQLGERIGVSGQAVGQWENGVTLPRGFHVQQLVRELDIDPMKLLASIPRHPQRKH